MVWPLEQHFPELNGRDPENAKAEVQTLLVADGGRCAEDPTLCQLNRNILLRSGINLRRAGKLEPHRAGRNLPRRNKMQKWEYYLMIQNPSREPTQVQEALTNLGESGWELVSIYMNDTGNNVFILKKPKR